MNTPAYLSAFMEPRDATRPRRKAQTNLRPTTTMTPNDTWTSEDVATWCRSIGQSDLATTMTTQQITGQDLLSITDKELQRDLGIEDACQRSQILAQIRPEEPNPNKGERDFLTVERSAGETHDMQPTTTGVPSGLFASNPPSFPKITLGCTHGLPRYMTEPRSASYISGGSLVFALSSADPL